MTDTTGTTPSRRALLAGALGGLGAWAASAIGRRSPVRAANGDDILVAGAYSATGTTSLTNTSNTQEVFSANSSFGTALFGLSGSGSGVDAISNSGHAVNAVSTSAMGVWSKSTSYTALQGYSLATNYAGAAGWSGGNSTGLIGFSNGGSGLLPAAKARTGVFGYAAQSSASKGVWGKSPAGHGIHGESSSGWAGYFDGRVLVNRYVTFNEISTPSAPASNSAKLFIRDNGSGKTQLCVRFHTGATKVLATQP